MSRHTVIPSVHLLLLHGDNIFLARRFQTGYGDGEYSVPAGHIEKGETATQAVIREALEEVGLVLEHSDLHMIHVMNRMKADSKDERVDFFFLCKKWQGDPKNMEPEKCDDIRWFPIANLPENTIPYLKHAIDLYQRSIFYSEYGWQGEP